MIFKSVFLRFLAVLLAIAPVVGAAAPAGAQSWIQVESQNNLRDTRLRAQFFAQQFPDTHAFQTTSAWNAIAIGPMSAAEAQAQLLRLKRGNLIPADSFVADGKAYRTQLWPLKASTRTPTEETPPIAADNTVTITEAPASSPAPETPAETTTQAAAPDSDTTSVTADEGTSGETGQTPEATAPQGPIPDTDLRATKQLERSWNRDLKKQYQTYMVWTGDYNSAIDGAYGPGTRKAIRAFQGREGFQATGYLTQAQADLLQSRYDAMVARIGIRKLRDLDAGIEMLYPSKLVTFERFEPPFVHFKPANDSGVKMMLISQEGGRDMLTGLYDIMSTFDEVPPKGDRVKKRDWFVLSGRNDKIVSYTYARVAKGKIKGFTLVWPPKLDSDMQPLVAAMYKSFTPLDEYVLDETLGYGQANDQPVDLSKGLDARVPARLASGFIINADGVILTNTDNIDGCTALTLDDGTALALFARAPDLGLAILEPKGDFTPPSFALFSGEAPELGSEISIAGFSFPEVMDSATLNYGTITDTKGPLGDQRKLRVSAFLEKGDVGGPVLDDRGAVIGMDLAKPAPGSGLPEYVNFALKTPQITAMLDRHALSYGKTRAFDAVAPEDLAFMASGFTVKISCWR